MQNYNINLLQTLKAASNPRGILQQMAGNNPYVTKALKMTENKDDKGIWEVAEKLAKEQGKDFVQVQREVLAPLRQMGLI